MKIWSMQLGRCWRIQGISIWRGLPILKCIVHNCIEDKAVTHNRWTPELKHTDRFQDGIWTTKATEKEKKEAESKLSSHIKEPPLLSLKSAAIKVYIITHQNTTHQYKLKCSAPTAFNSSFKHNTTTYITLFHFQHFTNTN